jgi:hypothetical protein
LTSTLDGGEWSASCSCCFTPLSKVSQHHLDRRLGVPQSWPGQYEEVKIHSCQYSGSNSDPSVVQPVASRCTDCATTALTYII